MSAVEREGWAAADSLPATERALTLPVARHYNHAASDAARNVVTLVDESGTAVEFVPLLALKDVVAAIVDKGTSDNQAVAKIDEIVKAYGA